MKSIGCLALVLSILFGMGSTQNNSLVKNVESNEIIWIVLGTETDDNDEVYEIFNDKLEDKTGYRVSFQYIDQSQYDLVLAAGEEFDLIISPDHMGYWQNVGKGAFMELTEDDLKTNAPYIWQNGKTQLDAAGYDGKYYAVPGIQIRTPNRVLVARGDLMDSVGVDSLNNIEDIDRFLMGVAELKKNGETDIVPFNTDGHNPWMVFSMWASEWGWATPGSLSYGTHYYYSIYDDSRKIFLAVDKPEIREQSLMAKKWYDNGIFAGNVLINNNTSESSYRFGRSALAWTSSPESANILYNDLKSVSDADKWDTRFYTMYTNNQRAYNFLNVAVSVGARSKKKEAALKVLNAVYEDKELYRLIMNGVEGEHYEVNENNEYTSLSDYYLSPALGISNQSHAFESKYDYPYAKDMIEEMKAITVNDPLVNCPMQYTGNIAHTKIRLDDIYMEYTTPRIYGVVSDVDEAIKVEKNALLAAGIERYIANVQKSVDEYVASHPEAEETFKLSRNAASAYKKNNPNKVNPKNYK